MKRIVILQLLIILINYGCAKIHSGNIATPVRSESNVPSQQGAMGLIVSGEENNNLSSPYFGVIDFTFENTSQGWIKLSQVKVYFENDTINENVQFTSGKELKVWMESTQKKVVMDLHNKQVAYGSIAGVGLGLAATGDDPQTRNMGLAMYLGTFAALAVDSFQDQASGLEQTKVFPQTHLFAKDFMIPPGLFIKKWVVLNSKNHSKTGYIHTLYLEYETSSGERATLKLEFRNGSSEWQNELVEKS
ncbi:hypothetical protein WDW89_11045 [Deltaproteobacteria bacterium TL4]